MLLYDINKEDKVSMEGRKGKKRKGMERWNDGTKKIECKRNGKQKTRKSVNNKSAAAPRAMQSSKHIIMMFWTARRAQITVFKRVFCIDGK